MYSSVHSVLDKHSTKEYFIEYNTYRSNHLSHGVIALHRLGVSEERLNRFVDWYTPKLESSSAIVESKNADIDSLKGRRVSFYQILEHFEKIYREKNNNLEELIASEFPKLSIGVAGSALHGLIHLGYGFSVQNERVVLEGLAYLHHSNLPINSAIVGEFGKGNVEILDALSGLANDVSLHEAMLEAVEKGEYASLKLGLFQKKMIYLLTKRADKLVSGMLSLKIPTECFNLDGTVDVKRLARTVVTWIVTVYTISERRNDFFLLHGVTGAWALYQIIPLLKTEDALVALQHFLTVLLGVYKARNSPPLTVPLTSGNTVNDADWNDLVKRTVERDLDEHIFKLVQVCYDMTKDDPERSALYLQAAESSLANELTI